MWKVNLKIYKTRMNIEYHVILPDLQWTWNVDIGSIDNQQLTFLILFFSSAIICSSASDDSGRVSIANLTLLKTLLLQISHIVDNTKYKYDGKNKVSVQQLIQVPGYS